jgi:hypothetical protein
MKHVSRKYKKRTLRKSRVFRKKNRKTIAKKRNYKKRNTRKTRRMGGMYEEEDIEIGIKKPYPIFINPSNIPELKPPTPTNEPTSWKGFQRTSKKNIENYLKKGDFSRPPLTDSAEDRELLRAYAPEVFENSDNEFQTPRSSISSVGYGTPRSEEEKVQVLNTNTFKSDRKPDPILDIFQFKSPEEREIIARALERTDTSSDEEEDYYSEKNIEKRKKEKKENLKALKKEYGIDTDSD